MGIVGMFLGNCEVSEGRDRGGIVQLLFRHVEGFHWLDLSTAIRKYATSDYFVWFLRSVRVKENGYQLRINHNLIPFLFQVGKRLINLTKMII